MTTSWWGNASHHWVSCISKKQSFFRTININQIIEFSTHKLCFSISSTFHSFFSSENFLISFVSLSSNNHFLLSYIFLSRVLNERKKFKLKTFWGNYIEKLFFLCWLLSGKNKMTGCYSPWRIVANKLGVVTHHAR